VDLEAQRGVFRSEELLSAEIHAGIDATAMLSNASRADVSNELAITTTRDGLLAHPRR
jgi:hypothetical protein